MKQKHTKWKKQEVKQRHKKKNYLFERKAQKKNFSIREMFKSFKWRKNYIDYVVVVDLKLLANDFPFFFSFLVSLFLLPLSHSLAL